MADADAANRLPRAGVEAWPSPRGAKREGAEMGRARRSVTRCAALGFVAALGIASRAAAADGPPVGVYACYETRATMNAPGCMRTNVGCLGMQITPAPVMMFGLIDGQTYSDYDGKRGRYAYDGASGMLTMTDGSRQGWRYKRVAEWSFRALDAQGKETSFTCPLDAKKDPLKRPW